MALCKLCQAVAYITAHVYLWIHTRSRNACMVLSVASQLASTWVKRLSVTNLSSENNLPTFQLNAPVLIRAPTLQSSSGRPDDDWSVSQSISKLFSELKLVTDNLLFIYACIVANSPSTCLYVHLPDLWGRWTDRSRWPPSRTGEQVISCTTCSRWTGDSYNRWFPTCWSIFTLEPQAVHQVNKSVCRFFSVVRF